MLQQATDLLCSGRLLVPIEGTPGRVGLTGQCGPQDPGTVKEDNARGEQASCLQPPRRHRDEGEDERQHQSECDEEDVEATAGVRGPVLVDRPNDDEGATVADECANDQDPPHVFLQPTDSGLACQCSHRPRRIRNLTRQTTMQW